MGERVILELKVFHFADRLDVGHGRFKRLPLSRGKGGSPHLREGHVLGKVSISIHAVELPVFLNDQRQSLT